MNVDALTYAGNVESIPGSEGNPRYVLERVDIVNATEVERCFRTHRPSTVLHLAAESHVDRSIDGPGAFVQTNVVGTFNMLHGALGYWRSLPAAEAERFRFVHVSTDEVFGSLGPEGAFSETSPFRPNSPYSASKAGADHLARAWYHTYGFPVVTTNCSNNYGPYQFPEKLIPLVILNALEERRLPVYGTGGNVRDWLYVEDHVEALLAVAARGRPGETYAVGGRTERRNIDVVHAICDMVDEMRPLSSGSRRALIEFVTDRPGHDQRYAIDSTKIERELGIVPRESFESGLRKTVAWYLENTSWVDRVRSGAYRGERLGLGLQ